LPCSIEFAIEWASGLMLIAQPEIDPDAQDRAVMDVRRCRPETSFLAKAFSTFHDVDLVARAALKALTVTRNFIDREATGIVSGLQVDCDSKIFEALSRVAFALA